MHWPQTVLNDNIVALLLSLLCDGGNDQTDRKYFGIMVRYWNKEAEQPVTCFLYMPVCNIATAEALFTAIEKEFGSRKIPWSNMVSYASGTASVMVGRHNSVLSSLFSETTKVVQSWLPLPFGSTLCCCCS